MSRTIGNRRFFAGFLLAALLIAGVASYYASSHPDGLKFVAQKTGFIDKEQKSPTADSPFAGYSTKGIHDQRLSGGVAGVVGCLLVLGIGGGLFWVLRRRDPETADPEHAADAAEV
jgi:cobalt/nickel transport protein